MSRPLPGSRCPHRSHPALRSAPSAQRHSSAACPLRAAAACRSWRASTRRRSAPWSARCVVRRALGPPPAARGLELAVRSPAELRHVCAPRCRSHPLLAARCWPPHSLTGVRLAALTARAGLWRARPHCGRAGLQLWREGAGQLQHRAHHQVRAGLAGVGVQVARACWAGACSGLDGAPGASGEAGSPQGSRRRSC